MSDTTPHAEETGAEKPSMDVPSMRREFAQAALDQVSEIGTGRRWYDFPYKALDWLVTDWRRKFIPRKLRTGPLNYALNYLLQFHSHDIHGAWSRDDPLHNLFVPQEEHVALPALWVVELFPPSEIAALLSSLEANGWDLRRVRLGIGEANQQVLADSRAGRGSTWWRLAQIAGEDSPYHFPDGTREQLPPEFGAIELMAIQIGEGVTAVLAFFHLNDRAAARVDTVWHENDQPRLVWSRGRPRAEDRMWTAYRTTQQTRRAIHTSARSWLARACPGFFATHSEAQPLLDLLLFDKQDPLEGERMDRTTEDALRALGLTDHFLYRTSTSLPKLLLTRLERDLCPVFEDDRTWTLWGNADAVAKAMGDLSMYGQNTRRGIARRVYDNARNFLLMLAVSDLLVVLEAEYAELRDTAKTHHGRFRASQLRRLRDAFLTMSLDLASVARDVARFWRRPWTTGGTAQFKTELAPWAKATQDGGEADSASTDLNDRLQQEHEEWFARLLTIDREYRDILSTVANLGASIDTFRMARIATAIAVASLVVAATTLLVSGVSPDSPINEVLTWLRTLGEG